MSVLKCLRRNLNERRRGSLSLHLPSDNRSAERNSSALAGGRVMGVGCAKKKGNLYSFSFKGAFR